MTPTIEYAVYKGDDMIAFGTKTEIMEKLHVKKKTVEYWATPSNIKRVKRSGKVAIRLENNDDR